MKYAFSNVREHLQFNFNSHVFIDQMVWYAPCMVRLALNVVRFVLKRGPFCPGRGPFCPGVVRFVRGLFCPWSVSSLIRV